MDHPGCLQEVSKRFRKWLNDDPINNRPHPDLRSLIYSHGMRSIGNEADWNKMFDIYTNEQDANEKSKLRKGLSAIRDAELLQKYIDLASANETFVRKQDYFSVLSSVAENPIGKNLVWSYVTSHWDDLIARFGLGDKKLGRIIEKITKSFANEDQLKQLENFFEKNPDVGAGDYARKQALENIQNNIKWLKRNKNSVGEYLQSLNL